MNYEDLNVVFFGSTMYNSRFLEAQYYVHKNQDSANDLMKANQ